MGFISHANIFWFLYSSMTVNWSSLGCGQNNTFEEVIVTFTLFLFYTQNNWLIETIIDKLIDNKNVSKVDLETWAMHNRSTIKVEV